MARQEMPSATAADSAVFLPRDGTLVGGFLVTVFGGDAGCSVVFEGSYDGASDSWVPTNAVKCKDNAAVAGAAVAFLNNEIFGFWVPATGFAQMRVRCTIYPGGTTVNPWADAVWFDGAAEHKVL